MNIFGGLGNFGHTGGNNCCCLIWLILILQLCGCENTQMFGCDCMSIIFLLLLLSCCGCNHNAPCGN